MKRNITLEKKYLLALIMGFSIYLLSGCSLDIPVENQLSDPQVVQETEDLRSLLVPAYKNLPDETFDLSIYGSDFYPTSWAAANDPTTLKLYKWDAPTIINYAEDYWQTAYHCISDINNLLERVPKLKTNTNKFNIDEVDHIVGEALLLKAYIYYRLLCLYATPYQDKKYPLGIVLHNKVYKEQIKRSTKEECVKEIKSLINEALPLLEKGQETNEYELSVKDLYAMKADIGLYIGDYKSVLNACSSFDKLYPLSSIKPTDYNKDFWLCSLYSSIDTKHIWTLQRFDNNYYKGIIGSDVPHFDEQCYLPALPLLLGENDPRKPFYEMNLKGFDTPILGKYNMINVTKSGVIKGVAILRPVLVIFDKAEALIWTNQAQEANEILKMYLGYDPGISNSNTTTQNLSIFSVEKEKEFIGEGLNFYDLKRWGFTRNIYNISGKRTQSFDKNDYRFTWPIPASEMKFNKLITKQNEGWPTFKLSDN